MYTINPLPQPEAPPEPPVQAPPGQVMLADGTFAELEGRALDELQQLQYEQERKFAAAIMACPAGSHQRGLVVGQAYDTVCGILAAQQFAAGQTDAPLIMGFDQRYTQLVLRLLEKQIAGGMGRPHLFEIGYGSGALLKEVRAHGHTVGGIEVSSTMRDQAAAEIGERYAKDLLLGDFREVQPDDVEKRPTVIFWNDVLEHLGPDEVQSFVDHAHKLLAPGGVLVTITPNWLLRPSDVTAVFHPPRTQACGLHLKEYRLKEVARLLRRAGFRRIATPLFATHGRLVTLAGGGRLVKQLLEPALDKLPVKYARLLCRGWAMSITLATKRRK